jgi:hypothetical protein
MKFVERASDVRQIDSLVKDKKVKPDWTAFAALIRRKWFNRRWVVQELHFAKWAIVHCGSESVRWPLLATAISLFEARSLEVQAMLTMTDSSLVNCKVLGEYPCFDKLKNVCGHPKSRSRRQCCFFGGSTVKSFNVQVTNP